MSHEYAKCKKDGSGKEGRGLVGSLAIANAWTVRLRRGKDDPLSSDGLLFQEPRGIAPNYYK